MKRFLAGTAFLLLTGTLRAPAAAAGFEETRAGYERLAAEMPYLSLEVVLWQRSREFAQEADPTATATHLRVFARLSDGTDRKEDLLALLTHPDPKVRTLAAVALFERQDPSVLPALAALVDDKAVTFDGHGQLSEAWLHTTGVGPPRKEQTVGFLAEQMVDFYLQPAGFSYGVERAGQPGFAEYWVARKDRAFCATWFTVQMKQATGGIHAVPAERRERIAAVRRRVEALPGDEPAWLFLWLDAHAYEEDFATEAERVAAGRQLGPDKLLLMLQGRIPSDDPDLQARGDLMQTFVLRHAVELLRPQDSAALLACEVDWRQKRDGRWSDSAWWAAAAARLDPGKAPSILRAALASFGGPYDAEKRTILRATLWQVCGRSELAFILDGLYGERTPNGSPSTGALLIETTGEGSEGRTMLAAIVRDRRFDDLNGESLEKLVRIVNAWTAAPVVTEDELRKAWHPLGQGHYTSEKASAAQSYPKESAELEAHLAEWRGALRRSVDRWVGEPPGK